MSATVTCKGCLQKVTDTHPNANANSADLVARVSHKWESVDGELLCRECLEYLTGRQLALDGQDAAITAAVVAHHDHPSIIAEAIDSAAATGDPFSADDIRAALNPETVAWIDLHHRAWSALWARARQTGKIHAIGYTATCRRTRHGNMNRVWEGMKQ